MLQVNPEREFSSLCLVQVSQGQEGFSSSLIEYSRLQSNQANRSGGEELTDFANLECQNEFQLWNISLLKPTWKPSSTPKWVKAISGRGSGVMAIEYCTQGHFH